MRSDMTFWVGLVMAAIGITGALWHLSGRWRKLRRERKAEAKRQAAEDAAAADAEAEQAAKKSAAKKSA